MVTGEHGASHRRAASARACMTITPVLAVLLPIGETSVAKMRVFRYPIFLGSAFARRCARGVPPVRVAELLMHNIGFDVAHLLAGSMLALSFVLLYQDRITAVLNVFALQAIALSLSVAWQAYIQEAPHLFDHRRRSRWFSRASSFRPRCIGSCAASASTAQVDEEVIGAGPTMLFGLGLVALSILLVLPVGQNVKSRWRARTWPSRSRVILLGLPDDDHALQRGDADHRLHVAGERPGAGRDRRQGHAAGGRDSRSRSRS